VDWNQRDVTSANLKRIAALALAGCAIAAPGMAAANSAAVDYFRNRADRSAVPALLTADERTYYRDLFAAIDRADWARVQALFAQKADGPLHQVARAEYYLAAGSPKIEGETLGQWLAGGTSLPQAEQVQNLALKRGALAVPSLPAPNALVAQPNRAKRIRPRETGDGTMPGAVAAAINGRIKADDPGGAKALLDGIDTQLSPYARAEWRAKVAWSYYIENDNASAYLLAQAAQDGAGPWVAEGWWTAGLAAWRLDDCTGAAEAFARTAGASDNAELTAAAWYWQSRSLVRCRKPDQATAPLRQAARLDETLYGMLAAEQLGTGLPQTHTAPDFTQTDWQKLRDDSNVRTVVGLAEIGRDGLADEVLRHQARIGTAEAYQPLSRLARDLGLPATQLWMAYNAPWGGKPEPAARFPGAGLCPCPAGIGVPRQSRQPGGRARADADHARCGARSRRRTGRRGRSERPCEARNQPRLRAALSPDAARRAGHPGAAAQDHGCLQRRADPDHSLAV
jgi:soluble lytic murein transglycosylase